MHKWWDGEGRERAEDGVRWKDGEVAMVFVFLVTPAVRSANPQCNWGLWSAWSECEVCGSLTTRQRTRGPRADTVCSPTDSQVDLCVTGCSM
jgi:hypothetical protein